MILIEQIIELLNYFEEKIQSLYKCFLYSFMYTQFETIQTAQKFTVTLIKLSVTNFRRAVTNKSLYWFQS